MRASCRSRTARPTSCSWIRRTRRTSSTRDDPSCIGELDAFEPAYFEAMDAVFAEAERVLRDRRYLAVYCSRHASRRSAASSASARALRAARAALPPDRPRRRRARQPQAREPELPPRRGGGELLPARLQPPLDLQEGARAGRRGRSSASVTVAGAIGNRGRRLERAFYAAATLDVARSLLGTFLVHALGARDDGRKDRRDRGLSRQRGSRLARLPRSDRAQRVDVRAARPRVRLLHLRHALLLQRRHRAARDG